MVSLSIILVLEKCSLGPWKSLKSSWILYFDFATNPVHMMCVWLCVLVKWSGSGANETVRLLWNCDFTSDRRLHLRLTTHSQGGAKPHQFCSFLYSSIRQLATPWMYFLRLSLSSVILIDTQLPSEGFWSWSRFLAGESCSRLDVVHPGRVLSSSPACTWHCSVHYLFLQATHLPVHNSLHLLPIALKLHNYEQVSAVEILQFLIRRCWHCVLTINCSF